MNKLKVTYISNAGILIESKKIKIMVDSIHCIKLNTFSTVPHDLLENIILGDGMFKDIDFILFTHNHHDHFNFSKTHEYLLHNRTKKVLLPELQESNFHKYDNLLEMKSDFKVMNSVIHENVEIFYFKTVHDGPMYKDVIHYSFIINIENVKILILGDADFRDTSLKETLLSQKIDIVFVNFLVINSALGRELINKIIKPNIVVIYHLPYQSDDIYNYRGIAKRDLAKYKNDLPETKMFLDVFDIINL